ncbi:MAG: hypothetical protein M3Z00_13410 [Actinomycetota bacterium]|nr:hypothetical protein [Actinomycetota bacterium]
MTGGVRELLHDPAGLIAADRAGLLPAAATAGAQLRALAEQLKLLPPFDRPRALLVAGSSAATDAALLLALVGQHAAAPIVWAPQVPTWVGPLDVVLVLADQPHDEVATVAAATAARRGAQLIVRCGVAAEAEIGPAAPGAVLLPPSMAVPESLAGPARLALLVAIAHRCGLAAEPDLAGWADALDTAALACHPSAEMFINPALSLAEYLTAGAPLLIGTDPIGDALAAAGAAALAELAGLPAAVLPGAAAIRSSTVLRRAATGRDLFADPLDDGLAPIAPVLVTIDPGGRSTRSIGAALSSAPVVGPDVSAELPTVNAPQPAGQSEPVKAAEVLLRLTFAAIYLGLAVGQLTPMDAPDGLGRAGTALGAVRSDNRGAFGPSAAGRDVDDDDDRRHGGLGVFDDAGSDGRDEPPWGPAG